MLLEIPENALSVYNALNKTDYKDPEMLEIMRLEKGIYLSIRNDASFVIDAYLNLYEHQSTVCPNMPLRCLIYVVGLYKKMVNQKNLFGRSRIMLPTPKFAVFYNGTEEQPDRLTMRLSDSFIQETEEPELELICRVIDINCEHSPEFLENCQILREYSMFVDIVRRREAEVWETTRRTLEEPAVEGIIEAAINECLENISWKTF